MTQTDPIFDMWREAYSELTPKTSALVNNLMARIWPQQPAFHLGSVLEFLDYASPRTIIEFGGFNGELAEKVLSRDKDTIREWVNIENCGVRSVCSDSRYRVATEIPRAEDFTGCVALIAIHSFEHISSGEAMGIVSRCLANHVYIDCPIPQTTKPDWIGYYGTHITDMSWHEMATSVISIGYNEVGGWSTNSSMAKSFSMLPADRE